ncbi:MAG: hypothetical protein ACI4PU_02195 [Intestinibacter sp.]
MTIVEIEYYKGDILLYGRKIDKSELKSQIREIEACYDRDVDNFIELFCRRFGWTIFETEDIPDFIYDRDIGKLYYKKIGW